MYFRGTFEPQIWRNFFYMSIYICISSFPAKWWKPHQNRSINKHVIAILVIFSDLRFESPQFPRPIALKLLRFLYYSKNKSFFFYHFEYSKANWKSLPCLVKKLANGGGGIRTEDIFWVKRSIRVFIDNNKKKKLGVGNFIILGLEPQIIPMHWSVRN